MGNGFPFLTIICHKKETQMRKQVLPIIFTACILLSGCVSRDISVQYARQIKAPVPGEYKEFLFKKRIRQGNTTIRQSPTDSFLRRDNARVYYEIKLFDLIPQRIYKMKAQWIAPSGKLDTSNNSYITPKESTWCYYSWIRIDPHKDVERPPGIWTVKLFIDGTFVSSKKFFVADTEQQMAALKPPKKAKAPASAKGIPKPTSPRPSPSQEGSKWAVIIGISQYQYAHETHLPNLIFADEDARDFARTLKKLGWSASHMKVLTNEKATVRNIMVALKSWLTKAGPGDQIILFWAGHGYPDPEHPNRVYFAAHDTDISIPATGYRMDEVKKALEEIGAKNVMVLADTCHAGNVIASRGITLKTRMAPKTTPKGWIFMVGADSDRKAIEHSSWSNGAFTHALIKGLEGRADGFQSAGAQDGIITMGELKEYMKTAMPDDTLKVLGVAKHPIITTSSGDPSIWDLTLDVKETP